MGHTVGLWGTQWVYGAHGGHKTRHSLNNAINVKESDLILLTVVDQF